MIITKMALPRRTFLRGLGATVALPLLDAMVAGAVGDLEDGRRAGQAPRLHLPAQRGGAADVDADGVRGAA